MPANASMPPAFRRVRRRWPNRLPSRSTPPPAPGEMLGKRVLVTGCGPIGVLCILAARRAGAAEIVATDLSDFTLALAAKVGADRTDQHRPRTRCPGRLWRGQGVFRRPLRMHRRRGGPCRRYRRPAPARGDPATGAGGRHDPSDDGDHRQGIGTARLLPLSPRIRAGRRPDAEGADRCEAPHHPYRPLGAGGRRLPHRLRPLTGDEGADRLFT
jgi:hypothetical protein